MGRMTSEVMTHDVSLMWQNIFTVASWAITLVLVVIAIRLGRRQRTPFYLFAVAAAGVGAYAEPLYDVAFDLWFYDAQNGQPGAGLMHFSAFGIPQPNWTHSGYIILYAGACLYAGRPIYEGRFNRKGLFALWGLEIVTSCIFEVIGTGTDVYTYYGPHVLRVWNYPLVIGVLEGTQVVLFTVTAVLVWRRASRWWELLGLFVLFPVTFFGANFGLGYPVIIGMHLDNGLASTPLIFASTLASIALCAVTICGLAAFFLPKRLPDNGTPASERTAPPEAQLAG